MPALSPEEVNQFVALGEVGRKSVRAGEDIRAEAAFRAQTRIFPANSEPFASLALLEASRGNKKKAIDYLRAAVVRGFTDMPRLEHAEAWTRLRHGGAFYALVDAAKALREMEDVWPGWNAFIVKRPPRDLALIEAVRDLARSRIDRMAPALGPHLAELWERLIERVTAALLETYVTERPEAPDARQALDRLMALYSGGTMPRWEVIPDDAAKRLSEVSSALLERFPDSPARATALVGMALARNADRSRRGALRAKAAKEIRERLVEVLDHHPDSPVVAIAAIGLARTDLAAGRRDEAAAGYRRFCERHAGDDALLARVRRGLGTLALELGGVPRFTATTLDGETVGPETLRGKVAVLDFWATWCRPCVDGFPSLRRIFERYGDVVVMLGISLDSSQDIGDDDLRRWIASRKLPGRQVHDGLSWDSSLVDTFGVTEIPFTVVVGPTGEVVAVNEHGKKLERAVKRAVRETLSGRRGQEADRSSRISSLPAPDNR